MELGEALWRAEKLWDRILGGLLRRCCWLRLALDWTAKNWQMLGSLYRANVAEAIGQGWGVEAQLYSV